jgi:hypothetical protein
MGEAPDDKDFVRKYKAYEESGARHDVEEHASTEAELREIIAHLVERRQEIKQAEIDSLESKATRLARQLKETERQKLLAEISCFKDILELQKRLREEDDERGC